MKLRITVAPVKIRTENIPNTIIQRQHYITLLDMLKHTRKFRPMTVSTTAHTMNAIQCTYDSTFSTSSDTKQQTGKLSPSFHCAGI
jgi:hypothetical protein